LPPASIAQQVKPVLPGSNIPSGSGVIVDYDKEGNLVPFEILDAPKCLTDTRKVVFELGGELDGRQARELLHNRLSASQGDL
jgi:Protein of unknown function (DUF2283)